MGSLTLQSWSSSLVPKRQALGAQRSQPPDGLDAPAFEIEEDSGCPASLNVEKVPQALQELDQVGPSTSAIETGPVGEEERTR